MSKDSIDVKTMHKLLGGSMSVNLEFPFGPPDSIDWTEINPVGHVLLKEVNARSWVKSTEYHAGMVSDIHAPAELANLDLKFVRGVIPDIQFRRIKRAMQEEFIARFYLNVNVYAMTPFMTWMKSLAMTMASIQGDGLNPVMVRYNPLRPNANFTITWDYWTKHEQLMIHEIAVDTLQTADSSNSSAIT